MANIASGINSFNEGLKGGLQIAQQRATLQAQQEAMQLKAEEKRLDQAQMLIDISKLEDPSQQKVALKAYMDAVGGPDTSKGPNAKVMLDLLITERAENRAAALAVIAREIGANTQEAEGFMSILTKGDLFDMLKTAKSLKAATSVEKGFEEVQQEQDPFVQRQRLEALLANPGVTTAQGDAIKKRIEAIDAKTQVAREINAGGRIFQVNSFGEILGSTQVTEAPGTASDKAKRDKLIIFLKSKRDREGLNHEEEIALEELERTKFGEVATEAAAASQLTASQAGKSIGEEQASVTTLSTLSEFMSNLTSAGKGATGVVGVGVESVAGLLQQLPGSVGGPAIDALEALTGTDARQVQQVRRQAVFTVSQLLRPITQEDNARFTDTERQLAKEALAALDPTSSFDQVRDATLLALGFEASAADRERRKRGEPPLFDMNTNEGRARLIEFMNNSSLTDEEQRRFFQTLETRQRAVDIIGGQ